MIRPVEVYRSSKSYVCSSCLRSMQRPFLPRHAQTRNPHTAAKTFVRRNTQPISRPLRVAVIGSGPSGFYTAVRLLERHPQARVDMFEQLPTPFGLVRYGVAPDHPEVKNCQDRFTEAASSDRFQFIGNVKIGRDIHLRHLKTHYDALLLSYGASEDRTLEIPGEDLDGVFSARAFVGWYNGLPEFRHLNPDLQRDDTAHIIGNGNVALDIARILLSDPKVLQRTDIAEHAIEALAKSTIKRVHIYGRRGPLQATFTIKEVRELLSLPKVAFEPLHKSFVPSAFFLSNLQPAVRRQFRIGGLWAKGSASGLDSADKSWALRPLLTPTSFEATEDNPKSVGMIHFLRNEYKKQDERLMPAARVKPTQEAISVPAKLVFRSIGYKALPIPGLEDLDGQFKDKDGMIDSDARGRVLGRPIALVNRRMGQVALRPIPGVYTSGWVKNGPTGVIASTMLDAFESADTLLEDWQAEVDFLNMEHGDKRKVRGGWETLLEDMESFERPIPDWISWQQWLKLDAMEKSRGESKGKPRDKVTTVDQMLRFAKQ